MSAKGAVHTGCSVVERGWNEEEGGRGGRKE